MLSPQHSSYTRLQEDPLTSVKLASPCRQLALKYDCHAVALKSSALPGMSQHVTLTATCTAGRSVL